MDHIPEEEIPHVAKTAHAVVQEAKDAGVFGEELGRLGLGGQFVERGGSA